MTQEQKELIATMDGNQWKAVVALATDILKRHEQNVLKCSVQDGSRKIVIAKASFDGAKALLDGIERARAEISKEK